MTSISVETLELLASKICHDLISPIGAVNNGLEIFEEMGPDAGEDVTDLISFSASQASAKLKAYRMAYGAGGADANIRVDDVYNAIQEIVGPENKVSQDWSASDKVAPELPPKALCKILICCLLLAKECLPKGGSLKVHGEEGKTIVSAHGPDAKLKEGFAESLILQIAQADLKPGMTHPYITGLLAQHYGFEALADEPGTDEARFTIVYPST